MSQMLREFAASGHTVVYVGTDVPFLFRFVPSDSVRFEVLPIPSAGVIREDGAIRTPDVLLSARLAEAMCRVAEATDVDSNRVILWGTYLYPYGLAAVLAGNALRLRLKGTTPRVWLSPTGSDVWEIGPQLGTLTEWLLESDVVERVITYTAQFAAEIARRYHTRIPISSIYPIIDADRFEAPSERRRAETRRRLKIPPDAFVISSHSNMRPVKHPGDAVAIADALARRVDRPIVLLMIGPTSEDLAALSTNATCRVVWTGVQERVEQLLACADVELNCSSHDSFNLSLAEAMACGLPCVSTDVVGIAPEIRAADAGFLFAHEPQTASIRSLSLNHENAVGYLEKLTHNESLRRQIGERARRHALETFTRSALMPSYLSLLEPPPGRRSAV